MTAPPQPLLTLRPITPEDNPSLQQLIHRVVLEYQCFGSDYLTRPEELGDIFQQYQIPKAAYWVIHDDSLGQLMGGGGYAPLFGTEHRPEGPVCEIQKMYFSPLARGLGQGKKLLQHILDHAEGQGYTEFYLETMPQMKEAQALYQYFGFEYLDSRMGNTGHLSCPVFMGKNISTQ